MNRASEIDWTLFWSVNVQRLDAPVEQDPEPTGVGFGAGIIIAAFVFAVLVSSIATALGERL